MIQIYTYTLTPPEGSNPREVQATLQTVVERMVARSDWMIKVETDVAADLLYLKLWFKGSDRWYIQKRIKFPVTAALRKAGMTMANIRTTQVETPLDGRVLRTPRKPPPPRWEPQDWYTEELA